MSHVRSFAPWIAYAPVAGLADWRFGAGAGLVVAVALWTSARRTGGADLLATVTCGFFAALATTAVIAPDAAVRPYTAALALGTLGLAAAASLAAGRPFTLTIARRETPPQLWSTDLFQRANEVITAIWAASLLATAAVVAAVVAIDPSGTPAVVGVQVVGFTLPVLITRAYRSRLAARLSAA